MAGHQGYPFTLAQIIYLFEKLCSIDYYYNTGGFCIYIFTTTMGKKTKTHKEERGDKKKKGVKARPKTMEVFFQIRVPKLPL